MTGKRLAAIRKLLAEHELDGLIVAGAANRRYFSGFSGSAGMLLIGDSCAYLLTDFRYREQAGEQAPGFDILCWRDKFYENLAALVKEKGWSRIGFEAKQFIYYNYREMSARLPSELVPLDEAVESLRMVKDINEQEILRKGAGELDRAFDYICGLIKPGMTERELALELEFFLRKRGAEEPSFQFIVASGMRGALPPV